MTHAGHQQNAYARHVGAQYIAPLPATTHADGYIAPLPATTHADGYIAPLRAIGLEMFA